MQGTGCKRRKCSVSNSTAQHSAALGFRRSFPSGRTSSRVSGCDGGRQNVLAFRINSFKPNTTGCHLNVFDFSEGTCQNTHARGCSGSTLFFLGSKPPRELTSFFDFVKIRHLLALLLCCTAVKRAGVACYSALPFRLRGDREIVRSGSSTLANHQVLQSLIYRAIITFDRRQGCIWMRLVSDLDKRSTDIQWKKWGVGVEGSWR